MKSIKEKSEEVFHIEEYDSFETELQKQKMRLCYEHGANYVLECFESILPFVAKKGIIYGKIKETIEQLKK